MSRALAAACLLASVARGGASSADEMPQEPERLATTPALVAHALDAWRATPALRIEDAYKWLFQATRGAEHAVPDEASAREWLAREWATLPPPSAQQLAAPVEWLRHDGAYVRLHLAAAKTRGISDEAVLQAFLASARATPDVGPAAFAFAWDALGEWLRQAQIGSLTRGEWERLDARMRPGGYPAVHHSDPYRAAYAPHYRVMRREEAEALLAARR